MSTTEKVTVTARHIKEGDSTFAERCPIALAISETHPGTPVEVYGGIAVLGAGPIAPIMSALLPGAAREFAGRFDDGYLVQPIEFELTWETPDEVVAAQNIADMGGQP